MSLSSLISSLIILFSGLGILVLFLRKLPEVIEQKNQTSDFPKASTVSQKLGEAFPVAPETQNSGAMLKAASAVKKVSLVGVKKVWKFMLEAKDHQQGQILASKFNKLMPTKRIFNIGAISPLRKAQRLFEEGDLAEAETIFLSVIQKHPHEYDAYEGLVKVYLKQKNYSDVQEILEYLAKHNPESDYYFSQLGSVMMKQRRFAEAISAYEKALAINNLVSTRYINIGLCNESLGDLPKAGWLPK
jgi:tetratricopeptide (TPR) repeat protein